jgi:hypothetical protein
MGRQSRKNLTRRISFDCSIRVQAIAIGTQPYDHLASRDSPRASLTFHSENPKRFSRQF